MYPVLFQIGNFEVRSYGVIVALSFLVALWVSTKEARGNGLQPQDIQDFAVYALLGGLVGARLYYVVFSRPAHFLQNPWEVPTVWRGGIGVIGALIGGFVVALWYCHKRKLSFLRLGDTLVPGIALGQTLGQFACLLTETAMEDLPISPAQQRWDSLHAVERQTLANRAARLTAKVKL